MAFTTLEGRNQILGDLGAATERIALAAACLAEAYEQLDVTTADRLEEELYRPAQKAFGRAKRTLTQFAERVDLSAPSPDAAEPAVKRLSVKEIIERAAASASIGDHQIAELQDTMLPIEVGDAELRAGLAEIRDLLAVLAERTPQFLRTLGR